MKKKSLLNCRWFHILFPVYAVYSLLYLISGQLHLDEGAYLYASRAVYQGAVPYRDFFFLQPPLFPYIYGFIQLVFSGLLYARLTSILFGFLTILILMKFVRRLSDRDGSYVFLALITMTPFQLYFFSISRLYSLTALFLSAGVLLIFEKQKPTCRRAVFGLCALALGLGTRLTILPFFLLACGYVLYKARDAKSKVLPPVIAVLLLAAVYLPFILLTGLDRFWFNIAGMNLSLHANDIHAAFAQKLRATFQLFRFYFPVWILLIPLMLRFTASIRNTSFKNLFSVVTGHIAVLWIGVLGMLVVHSSARIYQVSYQTIIMPLLCVLVAIEWRKMYLQADRQSRLLFRSCFAALWIVGIIAYGRTSISFINGKPALMALHEQAAFIAQHTQPHDKVFSADSPLAVTESGRDVLRGMAGSDLFPDWSTEKCLEYNVLNFDIMTDHVQNQEGALLIMGDKSFKKSLPHLENIPEERRNAFLSVIDEFYETIGVFPNLLLPDTFSYYKAPRMLRNSPPGKLLVFGIDAVGWDVLLPLIESGELPNMQRIFRTGGKANMKTLSPTVSVMLWTTMATGVFPERHGIDNWLAESLDSSGQQAITSDRRKVHAFWNVSGTKKVCIVNWWATWPVEPVNGIMISNRAHYPDMSYTVFPDAAEKLHHNIPRVDKKTLEKELRELNPYQTPVVLPEFFSQLLQKDRFYLDIAKQCLVTFSDIDIMAVFVRGVDILEHEYLRDVRHDATGIPEVPPDQRGIVRSYYRYLDRWLGEFLEIMGPETGVIIVSDHGMEPVETLPPLIEGLNLGKLLDTLSQFSEKPLLYRNFADNKRYPLGLKRGIAWTGDTPVPPDDVTQLAHELHRLKVENGQHFFTDVAIGENPDEVITLTINPSPEFQSVITWREHEIPVMSVTGMIIHPRSGQHWNSPDGVFMISGPGVQQSKEMRDIHIYEIMPSFLAWLGLPVSRDLDGKPQMQFFTPDFNKMHPVSWVDSYSSFERIKPVSVPSSIDQELRRELESLGYIHVN